MSTSSNSNKKNIKKKESIKKENASAKTSVVKKNSKNKDNDLKAKKVSNKPLKKDIDSTTEFTTRIRIDRNRLNDTGTLDTSFLEKKKENINKRKILVNEEQMKKDEEKRNKEEKKGNFFKDLVLIVLCVATLILSYYVVDKYASNSCTKEKTKVKTKTETAEIDKVILDDNYLFLGDYITDEYDLDKYFEDSFVVKSSKKDDKVSDFLNDLDQTVYQYNPSCVFIEVGLNDVLDDGDNEEIVTKITEIVNRIKENRSYAKIYVESIYPVNNNIDEDILENANEKSVEINQKLKDMAKENKVEYIDIYDLLADKDGLLDADYTDDGLSLNEDGYKVVTDTIKKYIEKVEKDK